jgi:hypothetical protein
MIITGSMLNWPLFWLWIAAFGLSVAATVLAGAWLQRKAQRWTESRLNARDIAYLRRAWERDRT